jgi:2-polyprenyl-6-methoxyphenol hydroxylase-like FAD-dependent oxidoreductase
MAGGRSAIVVGAGIGGLAAGIALRRSGWEVAVLERAPALHPLGAGLSIWPNGVAALRSLGVGAVCDAPEVPRSEGALRRADGSELAGFDPAAIEARFGAPLVGVHRGDLQEALLGALGEPPRTGTEVEAVGDGSAILAGGEELSADLVVGADGLHSTVREWTIGTEEPADSGIVAWRGVAASQADVPAGEWWGRGCVAGLLPLSGGRTYWYAAHRAGDEEEDLERRIAQFGPPVRDAINGTDRDARLRHRLYDRPPAGRWSRGPVTLLGDAAHPMLPFLGQGACSALEDAVALAAAVDGEPDIEAALAAYEGARRPRTAGLVKGSRQAARIALLGPGPLRALRNFAVAHTPAEVRLRQISRFVGD